MVSLISFFSAVPFFFSKSSAIAFVIGKTVLQPSTLTMVLELSTLTMSGLQQLKNSILYFLAGSIVINIRQYDDPSELAANQDRLYAGPGNGPSGHY